MASQHHTKNKGDIGVLKVQVALAEQGYTILIPLSEHQSFDIVAYQNGAFKRIQVKFRSMKKNGIIEVPFKSSWSDRHGVHTKYVDKQDIDVYAVYCPETDECYFLNPSQFGDVVSLRVNAPKNNQVKGIHLASDFLRVP
jgi:hypothetical protein